MKLTDQSFGHIFKLAVEGTEEELGNKAIADGEGMIFAWDAVPVCLEPGTGRSESA